MSGARRRSKSSWDNKEEAKIPFDSSFHGDTSPKRSNSEAYDVFMSDDFPHEPNDNMLYRSGNRGNRDRSRSPLRNRVKDRNHGTGIGRGNDERQRESYDSGDSNPRASSHNRQCKEFLSGNCRKGSQCRFLHQEQHDGSRFREDRNKDSYSDGYRKDNSDYHRGDNSNRNDNAYDNIKPPCRFFMRGNCNRNRCKFSHDVPQVDAYQESSHDNNNNNYYKNLDDKNKSWNDLESMGIQESSHFHSYQIPTTLNGDEKSPDTNGGSNLLEASRNGIPNETLASKEEQVPQVTAEKQILANALELLYSLPNSGSSVAPVSDSIKTSVPIGTLADSQEQGNRIPTESEPVGVKEETEKKKEESVKNTNSGKVEEGVEKAMRQFKIVLVEFVKEILKPTWKEGKMSREVYKTIVKKVVEKVSSSIQGVQIPRTQEKIDQYLAFSKSKITKLVEAYVGRLLKG